MTAILRFVLAAARRSVRPARVRGAQRLRHRSRMGRPRAGAGRRQGQRVRRHQRAAGSASRRGQAEPHRPRAQRRSRRRDGRGARDRLAAAGVAAGRQSARAAGQARLFRGGGVRDAARQADAPRSRRGRRARRGRSAHPDRSAQHRARRHGAGGAARRRRSRECRLLRGAAEGLRPAMDRRHRALGARRRAACAACRSWCSTRPSPISSRGSA